MHKFNIFFIILISLCEITSAGDPAGPTVDISALEEKMSDISKELKKIQPLANTLETMVVEGFSLFEVAWPVAKVVLSCAYDSLIKDESPELKAIKNLEEQMNTNFMHLGRELNDVVGKINCLIVTENYDNNVSMKIDNLFDSFFLLHTAPSETVYKDLHKIFHGECKGGDGKNPKPIKIIQYIIEKIRKNCKFEEKVLIDGEKQCKTEKLEQDACYPSAYLAGNQYKRDVIYAYAKKIALDLLKTGTIAVFCFNIMDEYAEETKNFLMEEIKKHIREGAKHMNAWIHWALEKSWPKKIEEYVIDNEVITEGNIAQIKSNKIDHQRALLDLLAEKIANEVKMRGLESYNYNVLVWPTYEEHIVGTILPLDKKNYKADCHDANFCVEYSYKGLRIFIMRYDMLAMRKEFALEAADWFKTNKARIKSEIEPLTLPMNYHKFDGLLNKIYTTFPEIAKYFGAAILMRDSASYDMIFTPYALEYGLSKKLEEVDEENVNNISSLIFMVKATDSNNSQIMSTTRINVCLLFFLNHPPCHFVKHFVNSPKNLAIEATPNSVNPHQFIINLKCDGTGSSSSAVACHEDEILLHFNPRFHAEQESNVVVMNSWGPINSGVSKQWHHVRPSFDPLPQMRMEYAREERAVEFPFKPGKTFLLKFEAIEPALSNNNGGLIVKITVDGIELHKFAYRNRLAGIGSTPHHWNLGFQVLEIKGDVNVHSVTFPE